MSQKEETYLRKRIFPYNDFFYVQTRRVMQRGLDYLALLTMPRSLEMLRLQKPFSFPVFVFDYAHILYALEPNQEGDSFSVAGKRLSERGSARLNKSETQRYIDDAAAFVQARSQHYIANPRAIVFTDLEGIFKEVAEALELKPRKISKNSEIFL